jgi:hypothetical protein
VENLRSLKLKYQSNFSAHRDFRHIGTDISDQPTYSGLRPMPHPIWLTKLVPTPTAAKVSSPMLLLFHNIHILFKVASYTPC